jgi:hypothetical protein
MKVKKTKVKTSGSGALRMLRKYFPKVSSVVDADKGVIVEVTTKDVANSNVKDHTTCALALACTRFFKADGVVIGLTTSYIIKGTMAIRFQNAGTTSREIVSFDRKAGFDTGFYHMTPYCRSSRLDRIRYESDPATPKKTPSGVRAFRHYTGNVRTTLGHYGIS